MNVFVWFINGWWNVQIMEKYCIKRQAGFRMNSSCIESDNNYLLKLCRVEVR